MYCITMAYIFSSTFKRNEKMTRVTLISDTHGKHKQIQKDIPLEGDILIHAGDFSSMGYKHECEDFLKWFSQQNYKHKVFICGNHELGVEENPLMLTELLERYSPPIEGSVFYLLDSFVVIEELKIYGSPFQPEFYSWAFNLPRGEALKRKWEQIPLDTDILITHGPAHGLLDTVVGRWQNLGCVDLYNRIQEINPLIHCCGHIHSGRGYKQFRDTHYFNASVLDERYQYAYKPYNIIINDDKTIDVL